MEEMGTMSFDEQSLRRDIAETWGEHGAHVDVFDALVKSRAAVIDQKAALIDEIDRLRALITAWADAYKGANVAIGGFNDDIEAYTDACDALRKAVGR